MIMLMDISLNAHAATITLVDLSVNARAVILLLVFCQILLLIAAAAVVWLRKGVWDRIFLLILLITAGAIALLAILTQAHKALIFGELPSFRWAMDLPLASAVLCLLLFTLVPCLTLLREYRRWKSSITRFSVKESIDQLPMGICFSRTNGLILLANRSMNDLCQQILGGELQDAERFWEILSGNEPLQGAERLSVKGELLLQFPDGAVRSIHRDTIITDGTPIVQLTATDITELYRLTEELRTQNKALDELNARLRRYGENVSELVRKQEWLDTKVRIHGEFGQALLAARRFLMHPDTERTDYDYRELLSQWSKNIAVLRQGAVWNEEDHSLEELYEAAKSVGVTIKLDGNFPGSRASLDEKLSGSQNVRNLFVSAAAEALTNAVKHADATVLSIRIEETEQEYIAEFTNDGKKPSAPITEGGGLSNLRRQVERAGGTMETRFEPEFSLILKVPKKAVSIKEAPKKGGVSCAPYPDRRGRPHGEKAL